MKDTVLIFKSQVEAAFNAGFVVDTDSKFAVEVINNSAEDLVLYIWSTLRTPVVAFSKYIDPNTDVQVTFTVPAGERHLRTFEGNAFPCYYNISGDLGAATNEALDSEIWISK